MSSLVCLVVTNNSSSIAVRDLIFSFLRASDKDKDLERSDVIVCLEDSFADSRVDNLRLRADDKTGDVPYGLRILRDDLIRCLCSGVHLQMIGILR